MKNILLGLSTALILGSTSVTTVSEINYLNTTNFALLNKNQTIKNEINFTYDTTSKMTYSKTNINNFEFDKFIAKWNEIKQDKTKMVGFLLKELSPSSRTFTWNQHSDIHFMALWLFLSMYIPDNMNEIITVYQVAKEKQGIQLLINFDEKTVKLFKINILK